MEEVDVEGSVVEVGGRVMCRADAAPNGIYPRSICRQCCGHVGGLIRQ